MENGWVFGITMTGLRCSGCTWAARGVYCTTLCGFLGLELGASGSILETPQVERVNNRGAPLAQSLPLRYGRGGAVKVPAFLHQPEPTPWETLSKSEANTAGGHGCARPCGQSHPNATYV